LKIKTRTVVVLVSILVVLVALFMFSTRSKPVKVHVAQVERGSIEETVANTRAGTVKPCRRAQMAPPSGGQIATMPISEGDHVKQGQLLLELWNEDLKAQIELARSQAQAAKDHARSICVQADNAERNAKRKVALRKSQSVSEEVVEQAVATAKSSRADCEAAQTDARVSRENINVLTAQLERTLLRAPFDGVVVEVNGEIGEYVTPSPPGIPTLPAVDMVDSSCFYVSAPIDEVDAPQIKVGMPARISLDAFKDRRFPANVRRVADFVQDREKQARTVDIEVNFDTDEDMQLMLPGYSADAEVILRTRDNVLRVPTEAVVDKLYVFVFNATDKVLEKRDVTLGLSNWDFTEITDGVSEGEQVVTTIDRKGVVDGADARIDENYEE
jgi:HlyD family secretion protein